SSQPNGFCCERSKIHLIDRTHRGRRGVARTLKTHLLSVFLPILMMLGGAPAPPPIETTGPATACAPMPPFASPHDRFGVNILRDYGESASDFDLAQTRIGWYLDYKTTGPTPPKVAYVRVFRVVDLAQGDWRSKVEQAVMASPGVIWFIGNETDR